MIESSVAARMLTSDEGEQRVQTAQAARFRDELDPILVDLPLVRQPARGRFGLLSPR